MNLYPIGSNGQIEGNDIFIPEEIRSIIDHVIVSKLEKDYFSPWVGYLACSRGICLGFCMFKSPPVSNSVEIAYATTEINRGQGIATDMATKLIEIARDYEIKQVRAQTLPENGPSTSVLSKLGFRNIGSVFHEEDGDVWEWHLNL